MAIIPQQNIFSWDKIDTRSDLDRLDMVLSSVPDEELMRVMEHSRSQGRNDYPVRAVWNSILAGVVFQHPSIESLRRELQRNGELRERCGFNPLLGVDAVPPAWVYTRFLRKLITHLDHLEAMFETLVDQLQEVLPDLGLHLAGDSKAIPSAGKPTTKDTDGRRETDADHGKKEYHGTRADGSLWTKVSSWFGFKLHLIVDARHELPLAYQVTRASAADTTEIRPLMSSLSKKHETLVGRSKYMFLDRGYDSKENNRVLYETYGIIPLIDIRHDWKDGDKTRLLDPKGLDRIVYDQDGTLLCVHASAKDARLIELTPLYFDGFEPPRKALKYRCPAAVYGYDCPERKQCGASPYGRVVRVPLELDRRRFVPVPRATLKWQRLYAQRTAVERVNSRLDTSFMFEVHFIRGLAKMKLRVGIALIIMLALACSAINTGAHAQMRSLVRKFPLTRAA